MDKAIGKLADIDYNNPDYELAVQLRKNACVYAAFKNHNEQTKLVGLLTDKAGKQVSWNVFRDMATPITQQYNVTWLETEYNQAIANAAMAQKWNSFAANAALYPNLQYRAIIDGRTRPDHVALNGVILPIKDSFWNTWYPPNDWGCRCSVTQTDKDIFRLDDLTGITPKPGFDFNPGIEKKLFADSTGYYNTDKKSEIESLVSNLINY